MELKTFDILLLFLLAIALSIVIGAAVVYFVDKKLNDIQINVPACPTPTCPIPVCPKYPDYSNGVMNEQESETVVNEEVTHVEPFQMMAKAMNDGVDLDLDLDYAPVTRELLDAGGAKKSCGACGTPGTCEAPGTCGTPIAPNPTNSNGQPIPPLVITQDSDNKTTKSVLLRQGYSSSPTDTTNKGDSITYPPADDIVRYNGDGCYRGEDKRFIRKLEKKDTITSSCRPYTDNRTREGDYNHITARMMTAGSNSANYTVDEDIDFFVPRLYMGKDPTISGFSYAQMGIETQADVDQIGSIPVNDYSGEPVPLSAFMYN